ncbi:MFS transporter [Spongisporangium articulatum]|uniref:MFS transporter n=1 Tax=Spongisporangium articulatum TaxID=3362603 RepID=A0ABW8AIZ7_9ACTN
MTASPAASVRPEPGGTTSSGVQPVPPAAAHRESRRRTALALASLALGGVAFGTAEFASMGVLPSVASALAVSEPTAGRIISAYALGVVTGAPVLAVLGSRTPRRSLLLALTALLSVANVASAAAPTLGVLVATRFVAGLPHGAFLGIAATVAASLVPAERRGRAIAVVILGLTIANVVAVPVSTAVGQHYGWRVTFAVAGLLGLLTLVAVRLALPSLPPGRLDTMTGELRALRQGQVWLAIAVCVVGFGGMFAVYTYLSSTLTTVSGIPRAWVPAVLSLFGVGMAVGTVLGGRLADRSVTGTISLGLVAIAVVMAGFTGLVHHPATAVVGVFGIGMICMTPMPSVQARLMDVAADAPILGASLVHSAANAANASGAWAGGAVLSIGAGYPAIGWVGAAMAATGVLLTHLTRKGDSDVHA